MKSNITVLKQNGTRNVSSQHSAVLVDRASLQPEGDGGLQENKVLCQHALNHMDLQRLGQAQALSTYIISFSFYGIPECAKKWVPDSYAFSWAFFSVLSVCFIQFQYVDLCFILFYFIISLFSFFPKKSVFLWETEMEWLWMGEGIWKEEEKEKPEPRHIMWEKKSIFNKGGNYKNNVGIEVNWEEGVCGSCYPIVPGNTAGVRNRYVSGPQQREDRSGRSVQVVTNILER